MRIARWPGAVSVAPREVSGSKEKFELVFMGGGALLDALGTRLTREPATPRESVGAAVHALGQALDEHSVHLDDPGAARGQLLAIRAELCEPKPRRLLLF